MPKLVDEKERKEKKHTDNYTKEKDEEARLN